MRDWTKAGDEAFGDDLAHASETDACSFAGGDFGRGGFGFWAGAAGLAADTAVSTSFSTMRPPGPVPLRFVRLISFSAAILRASGDALMRSLGSSCCASSVFFVSVVFALVSRQLVRFCRLRLLFRRGIRAFFDFLRFRDPSRSGALRLSTSSSALLLLRLLPELALFARFFPFFADEGDAIADIHFPAFLAHKFSSGRRRRSLPIPSSPCRSRSRPALRRQSPHRRFSSSSSPMSLRSWCRSVSAFEFQAWWKVTSLA